MTKEVAVILAAGKGTRMQSDLPKVLFPVCGRSMIHFVIDALAAAGVTNQIIVVGHQADRVQAELAERPESLQFVVQDQQLGTGHAVQVCQPLLRQHSDLVIVLAGDSPLLQPESLQKLIAHFRQSKPALLLGTLHKEDPTGLGRIVRDEAGNFQAIVEEKDATAQQRRITEVNMSTYLFDGATLLQGLAQLSNRNAQGEYYLTDMVAILRQAGRRVEALPILQACEALSINTRNELAIVDQTMRRMGYSEEVQKKADPS